MFNPFEGISRIQKEKLLKDLEALTINFKKNKIITDYIKNPNYIGIIVDGLLQIIKTDYNGNRIIIDELKENEIFGTKISALQNQEYDILTKEDTKIMIIDYEIIINHDKNYIYYSKFIKNLLKIIIDINSEKNNRIEILTKKTIRNKLLEYFSITSKKNRSKNIYIKTTLTDLADYLAIDRSAMMRELKHLKEEGFIEVKNKKITLLY